MDGDTTSATTITIETIAIATGITTVGITATDTTAITVMATMIVTTAGSIRTAAGETATGITAMEGTGTMMATGVNFQNGGMDSPTPSAIFLLRLIVARKLRGLYKSTQFLTAVVRTKLTSRGLYRHKARKAGIPTSKMS